VDFYAPYARLAIEIDGLIHLDSEVRARDVERQKDIEALGITILRFTNEQITGNMDDVLRSIRISLQNPLLAKERAG
jgi:very-short-patch-repair endonuclease